MSQSKDDSKKWSELIEKYKKEKKTLEDKLKIPRLASGKPKKNVNESECKEWTSTTGKKWGSTGSWKLILQVVYLTVHLYGIMREKLLTFVATEVINVLKVKYKLKKYLSL